MLYIDSDNALGSLLGDVDDGFALSALFAGYQGKIAAVGSVFGNTSTGKALRNTRFIGMHLGFHGPYVKGAGAAQERPTEASRFLVDAKVQRIAALGPLTNVAAALVKDPTLADRIEECLLIGSHHKTAGRWPPIFPMEFNLTKDLWATHITFASDIPLTIVPLDVAARLRLQHSDLKQIKGPLGIRLRLYTQPWQMRSRLVKGTAKFPIWDLVGAMYLISPEHFRCEETHARLARNGHVTYGASGRPVKLITGFDVDRVWDRFLETLRMHPMQLGSG